MLYIVYMYLYFLSGDKHFVNNLDLRDVLNI